jgi:hypothetical protein
VPGSVDLETGVGAWKFGVDNEQKSVYRYQPHLCISLVGQVVFGHLLLGMCGTVVFEDLDRDLSVLASIRTYNDRYMYEAFAVVFPKEVDSPPI